MTMRNLRRTWLVAARALLTCATLAGAAACGADQDGDPTAPATRAAATAVRTSTVTVAPDDTATATPIVVTPAAPPPTPPPPNLPPTQPAPPPPPSPSPAAGPQTLTIVAVNITFEPTGATLPAGSTVTLTFDNRDNAVTHNFEILDPSGALLAATELFAGPATRTLTFTLGSPGRYAFTCTVHPREMQGAIAAQ